MSYNEAQNMLMKHLPTLSSNPRFEKAGSSCTFSHLLIAPADSNLTQLTLINNLVFEGKQPNDEALFDLELIGKELKVFIAFLTKGTCIIIPLDSHLAEPGN